MVLDKGLILSILIASVFADFEPSGELLEKGLQIGLKCGTKYNFEQKDYNLDIYKKTVPKDLSEKHLCFLKCFWFTDGAIDEKGFLVSERLDEILSMLKFDNEDKKRITACLKKIKSINECADFIPIVECFTQKES
ncbi:hypothetical protein WA026_019823 [Henosepilachna vigintioctopunctata]|uniref:Uncharacterized protein n=1 Tax=Henosepilachna vigintioctopunctata TaxID=420089 RepID=A0AAW1VGA9_9CUCU